MKASKASPRLGCEIKGGLTTSFIEPGTLQNLSIECNLKKNSKLEFRTSKLSIAPSTGGLGIISSLVDEPWPPARRGRVKRYQESIFILRSTQTASKTQSTNVNPGIFVLSLTKDCASCKPRREWIKGCNFRFCHYS